MKKIFFGASLIWLLVSACKNVPETETEAYQEAELATVDELAWELETAFNSFDPYEIKSKFDPALFAWRLGSDFKKLHPNERQLGYSIFDHQFDMAVEGILIELKQANLKMKLFDIHQKDGVYRLNYFLSDLVESTVFNYFVIYLDKDRKGAFKIVNIYNVFSGFSYGQEFKEYFDRYVVAGSKRRLRGFERATDLNQYASELVQEDPKKAYETFHKIEPQIMKLPTFAAQKVVYAAAISDSLFLKDLEWLKSVSPNDQSKAFYECRAMDLSGATEKERLECYEQVRDLLQSM